MQTDKYYLCKDLIGSIDSLTSSAKQTIDSIEAYNENSKTGATAKFSIYTNGNTILIFHLKVFHHYIHKLDNNHS